MIEHQTNQEMKIMSNKNDDNRANQLNPNNDAYYQSRGYDSREDYENQQSQDDSWDDDWDDDEDDEYYAGSDENEWDPDEEFYEYEDWGGDSADEREEAYDNFDWNALD